jgi:hypothetical protein
MPDFNPVYEALAERMREELGIPVLRTNRPWNLVDTQPALLVLESDVTPEWRGPGLPPVWTLGAVLTLYSQQMESDPAPVKQVLEIVERIHVALKAQPGEQPRDGYSTTLGGLVRWTHLGAASIGNVVEHIPQIITEIAVVMELGPSQ